METSNYREQIDYLSNQYQEWNGYDFYRFLFPDNEVVGELNTDFSKPNAVFLYGDPEADSKRTYKRRIMLNDTWEEDYINFVEGNPKTLCSGLTYRGRTNKLEHAQRMNALVFDLDGVGILEIQHFFSLVDDDPNKELLRLPRPTFVVTSGSGLHLYYVFEKPIDLYPNIKIQLKALKYDLTRQIWLWRGTSQNKEVQYQSISQGFRMVGSVNEKYGLTIRAFKTGERMTIQHLNLYARSAASKVDLLKPFKPTKISLLKAKENYPEWYERVIVNKNKAPKKWNIAGQKGHRGDELYRWWVNQAEKAVPGHRYFFLMCMAIYACKCDVPKAQLKKDMYEILPIIQQIEHVNELTKDDVKSALEAYDKAYYNYTIREIEILSSFRIERSKRNKRKQPIHLKLARGQLAQLKELGETSQGRPSKETLVQDYIKNHPNESVTEVARALNVDRKTVYKYR